MRYRHRLSFLVFPLVAVALVPACGDNNPSSDEDNDTDTDDGGTDSAGGGADSADGGADGEDTGGAGGAGGDGGVDPCGTDNGGCDPLTDCSDDQGQAVCGDCPSGYLGDGLTGCAVDACATDNGGCNVLRECESANAQATCGDCVSGYQEDGSGGCEVDACATDNGACGTHRICESAATVATCGECEFGYDDEEGVCIRNACTLARVDTYEPDAFIDAPVTATLTAEKTTWNRSLSAGDVDYFFLAVSEGCQFNAEWTHEGTTSDATYAVWSPQYGAGNKHAQGAFTETGTATVAASLALWDMSQNVIITSTGLCASYSLTAWVTCPAP